MFPSTADHNEKELGLQVKRQTVTTSNVREQFEVFAQDIREDPGLNFFLDFPLGSLDSELAIVYGISQWKESSLEENSHNVLPFQLDKIGLTATNSVIWPIDLGSSRKIQLNQNSEPNKMFDYVIFLLPLIFFHISSIYPPPYLPTFLILQLTSRRSHPHPFSFYSASFRVFTGSMGWHSYSVDGNPIPTSCISSLTRVLAASLRHQTINRSPHHRGASSRVTSTSSL